MSAVKSGELIYLLSYNRSGITIGEMTIRGVPYAKSYGGNGELIVLLHGFLGSKGDWSKLGPKMAKAGYRVVAIDLLGFGNAPKPLSADYSYDDHIVHIESVLAEIGIIEPFILMGHSMGALIAKRFTLLHENRVKQLVLLHPPLYRDTLQVRDTLRDTSYLYRFLLDSKYRNIAWPVIRLALFGRMRHTKWSRERSLRNVIEKAEAFKDLVKLKQKTLLFVGLRDRPEYIENLKVFSVADSVSITFSDVTHMSPMQNPRYVKRSVLKFLAQ